MLAFKGWAIPGQELAASVRSKIGSKGETASGEAYSVDALSGLFGIAQLRDGHRFSTDDLLVAWYGQAACPRPGKILDLGSGIGTIAQILCWKNPMVPVVSIEAQLQSVELARISQKNNDLSTRWTILEGDFRDESLRQNLGKFDLVCGSPPYFPIGTGELSEHGQKQACRFEMRGDISDYAKVAADHLAPGGVFSVVFPNVQKLRSDQALKLAGLSVVKTRAVQLREGEEPLLRLYLCVKKGDFPDGTEDPLWNESDLIIRNKDGRVSREYRTIKFFLLFPPNG